MPIEFQEENSDIVSIGTCLCLRFNVNECRVEKQEAARKKFTNLCSDVQLDFIATHERCIESQKSACGKFH